jgi:hypothetical protein
LTKYEIIDDSISPPICFIKGKNSSFWFLQKKQKIIDLILVYEKKEKQQQLTKEEEKKHVRSNSRSSLFRSWLVKKINHKYFRERWSWRFLKQTKINLNLWFKFSQLLECKITD